MSEPVTALGGASQRGGIVEITEDAPQGMISLRGDMAAKPFVKAAVAAAGVNLPEPRKITLEGARGMAWMSPDELLILCPYDEVPARLADLQDKLRGHHALAVNVSDARAVFTLRGGPLRDVLAKLAPVDLRDAAFGAGDFRRTRFAQVPAAFWMPEQDVARVVCFRSVARYMFDLLSVAAQPGSQVGLLDRA